MATIGPALKGSVRLAAASHIGASPKRTLLEDRSRAEFITTRGGLELAIGVVADGIGGENAGERAAELTVQTILDYCKGSGERNVPRLLETALQEANRRVYAEARRSRRKTNMGSTAAVAAIADGRLYVANAGDSRIYLLRAKKAYPLTIDHTWEHEVVQAGKLTRLEAAKHPRKDEIVRSIGYDRELEVDLGLWLHGGDERYADARTAQGMPLERGDVVLLCSDGLVKRRHDRPGEQYVEVNELAPLVRGKPPKRAADDLIKKALARQTDDNVSTVVLQMPGGRPALPAAGPLLGVAAAAAMVVGAAAWGVPRLVGEFTRPEAIPTIPALPSGVAYVSDASGRAAVQRPGGEFESLGIEALVAAGPGVRLRTQGPGSYLRLGLADGSIVYLGPDSRVELLAIGGSGGSGTTQLRLEAGIVLLAAEGTGATVSEVHSPTGLIVQVLAAQVGASWDERSGQFQIDCFGPACDLIFPGGIGLTLLAGQHTTVARTGEITGPDSIDEQRYAFGGYVGGLVSAPVDGREGTPEPGAPTATRTPLGPLFVSPTPPPPPPPTKTPERDPEPPPPPPPTAVPPSATSAPSNTSAPTKTSKPPKTDTPPPPPTDTQPPPSDTQPPPPTDEPPTDPPDPTAED